MNLQERLHTTRLQLNILSEKDLNVIQFLRSDPEVNYFIRREKTDTEIKARQFIQEITGKIKSGEICYWSIYLLDEAVMIGTICLWNFNWDEKKAEIGYELHPEYQKKGYMREAMQVVLHFGFKRLNLDRIEAFTHRNNNNSIDLLTKLKFSHHPELTDPGNENNSVYIVLKA